MTVAVITLAIALIAVLVANQRTLGILNAAREQERKDWTRERQLLLNRIKPETAQYVEPETVHAPQAVDKDFWESKEQLAERGAREETAK
jgi:septum formation inhibitor-activating ATPase MinD